MEHFRIQCIFQNAPMCQASIVHVNPRQGAAERETNSHAVLFEAWLSGSHLGFCASFQYLRRHLTQSLRCSLLRLTSMARFNFRSQCWCVLFFVLSYHISAMYLRSVDLFAGLRLSLSHCVQNGGEPFIESLFLLKAFSMFRHHKNVNSTSIAE